MPTDSSGNVVPLADFESMPDQTLAIWRDHLVNSFSSKTYSNPFGFKYSDGQLPQLVVLKMGSKKSVTVNQGRKRVSISKRKMASKQSRKKKKGSQTDGDVIDSDSESMALGSDTFSDDVSEIEKTTLPSRTKLPRRAAVKASVSIGSYARREAVEERSAAAEKAKPTIVSTTKVRPGSLEQRRKKTTRLAEAEHGSGSNAQNNSLIPPTSLVFQSKTMGHSTLLPQLRLRAFDPKTVSALPWLFHRSFCCTTIHERCRCYIFFFWSEYFQTTDPVYCVVISLQIHFHLLVWILSNQVSCFTTSYIILHSPSVLTCISRSLPT